MIRVRVSKDSIAISLTSSLDSANVTNLHASQSRHCCCCCWWWWWWCGCSERWKWTRRLESSEWSDDGRYFILRWPALLSVFRHASICLPLSTLVSDGCPLVLCYRPTRLPGLLIWCPFPSGFIRDPIEYIVRWPTRVRIASANWIDSTVSAQLKVRAKDTRPRNSDNSIGVGIAMPDRFYQFRGIRDWGFRNQDVPGSVRITGSRGEYEIFRDKAYNAGNSVLYL